MGLYVQFKVQLDVLFYVLFILLYSSLYMFRVLFAPILRSTTAAYSHRRVYGFGMLVHWSRYWLGHLHTCSTVKFRLVPAQTFIIPDFAVPEFGMFHS
jgi:hypothetical protein